MKYKDMYSRIKALYKTNQSFVIIASIMLLTGGVGIVSIYHVSNLTSEIYLENVQPTEKLGEINNLMNLYRLKVYQQVAQIEINETLQHELPELAQTIDQQFQFQEMLFLTAEEQSSFNKLRELWETLKGSYDEILEMSLNYAKEEALAIISGKNQMLSENRHASLTQLIALKSQGIRQAYLKSQTIKVWSLWGTFITLVAGIAVCLFFVKRYHRKIQSYTEELEEKNKIIAQTSQAYSRFFPHEFLKHMDKKSIIDVDLGNSVQRNMAILFSDLRAFTTFSEGMTPEENFQFLNAYLGQMSPIIREHHGFIDKYIGDAIMALFDRDVDDAVKAGIAMLKQLNAYNQTRQRSDRPPVQMGIGIHVGNMMLGTIGEQKRMETTVISDVVNLASRLEGMTKIYGVSMLISDAAHNSLVRPSSVAARVIDRVQAKGKTQPVSLFEVYNGDIPEIFDKKSATRKDFQEGVTLYYLKEFTEAKHLFEKCLSVFPEDQAAHVYIKRCVHYLKMGWDEDWDGITRLDTK